MTTTTDSERQPSRFEKTAGQVWLQHFALLDDKDAGDYLTVLDVLRIAHEAERDGWPACDILTALHELIASDNEAAPEYFESDTSSPAEE